MWGKAAMRKNGCKVVSAFALLCVVVGEATPQTALQATDVAGVVARLDERSNVVVLEDGRMIRATPATVIMVGGAPAKVRSLQPGTAVVIRSGEPVALSHGQYVVVGDFPAASIPVGSIRTRTYGRVKDIDRDGDVKIKTQSGTFHVKVSPDAARTLKDGDTATIDVVITPPAPTVR
jgi:hypothetical protein